MIHHRQPWQRGLVALLAGLGLTVLAGCGGGQAPAQGSQRSGQDQPSAQAQPAGPAQSPGQGSPAGASGAAAVTPRPPDKPVEFVVTTEPGGGSDQYARFITSVIDKYKLSPQPFLVVNKPGGAGAVGLQYLYGKKGGPNAVLITLNSVFTTPQLQKLPFKAIASDFTPVALMALDPFVLWTHVDSWKTWDDFVKAARERSVTVVGTGSKQEDEILFNLLQRALGGQPFKYVPEKGGGQVAAQVAGKHVEASVNQPSEASPHYPDRMRPLVAFTEERLKFLPDVPTYKEVGLGDHSELAYYQVRGIIAAPGIPEENRAWLVDLFKRVFETKEWQDYLSQNMMVARFLGGDEFRQFLHQYDTLHAQLMRDIGWVK